MCLRICNEIISLFNIFFQTSIFNLLLPSIIHFFSADKLQSLNFIDKNQISILYLKLLTAKWSSYCYSFLLLSFFLFFLHIRKFEYHQKYNYYILVSEFLFFLKNKFLSLLQYQLLLIFISVLVFLSSYTGKSGHDYNRTSENNGNTGQFYKRE